MSTLDPNKVGVRVDCPTCHYQKKPIGRSAPLFGYYCDFECSGYGEAPYPGSLWPNESEWDFGYPVGTDGTNQAAKGEQS